MQDTLDDRRERIVVHAAQLADGPSRLADEAADLLADGESMSGLGRLFGISRQSASERFGIALPRDAAQALRRIESWHGTDGPVVRLSSTGRFVVFHDGTSWRILRHTAQVADAEQLASGLGRTTVGGRRVGRYIRKPHDLTPPLVEPWALGPYALLTPASTEAGA